MVTLPVHHRHRYIKLAVGNVAGGCWSTWFALWVQHQQPWWPVVRSLPPDMLSTRFSAGPGLKSVEMRQSPLASASSQLNLATLVWRRASNSYGAVWELNGEDGWSSAQLMLRAAACMGPPCLAPSLLPDLGSLLHPPWAGIPVPPLDLRITASDGQQLIARRVLSSTDIIGRWVDLGVQFGANGSASAATALPPVDVPALSPAASTDAASATVPPANGTLSLADDAPAGTAAAPAAATPSSFPSLATEAAPLASADSEPAEALTLPATLPNNEDASGDCNGTILEVRMRRSKSMAWCHCHCYQRCSRSACISALPISFCRCCPRCQTSASGALWFTPPDWMRPCLTLTSAPQCL